MFYLKSKVFGDTYSDKSSIPKLTVENSEYIYLSEGILLILISGQFFSKSLFV